MEETSQVARTVYETISETITQPVQKTIEVIKQVPRIVYDTVTNWATKTVPVIKTVYDTIKETAYRLIQKPVQVTKQVIETVMQTGTRIVEKVVPVVRQVTDYVTQQVEESYQVARVVYDKVVEKTPTPVGVPVGIISGILQELYTLAEGLGTLVLHPIQTGENIISAVVNYDKTAEAIYESLMGRVSTIVHIDSNSFIGYYNSGVSIGKTAVDVCTIFCTLGGGTVAKGTQVAKITVDVTNTTNKFAEISKIASALKVANKTKAIEKAKAIGKITKGLTQYTSQKINDVTGKIYRLQKMSDGKLRYLVNGERRTTPSKIDYILQDGKLKFGEGHSYISGGEPIQYAGKIKISSNGLSIEKWTNESGHYKPRSDDIVGQNAVTKAFKEQLNLDLGPGEFFQF